MPKWQIVVAVLQLHLADFCALALTVQFQSIRQSRVTRLPDETKVCHRDLDKVIFAEIRVFSVTEHQFWFPQRTAALNSTCNAGEMAGQRAAPDEILSMSQASRRSDEKKISSGMSQSRRGDELIEIVQYLCS